MERNEYLGTVVPALGHRHLHNLHQGERVDLWDQDRPHRVLPEGREVTFGEVTPGSADEVRDQVKDPQPLPEEVSRGRFRGQGGGQEAELLGDGGGEAEGGEGGTVVEVGRLRGRGPGCRACRAGGNLGEDFGSFIALIVKSRVSVA